MAAERKAPALREVAKRSPGRAHRDTAAMQPIRATERTTPIVRVVRATLAWGTLSRCHRARSESCAPVALPAQLSRYRLFLNDPVVALIFEFESELFVTGADDAAIHQHVDEIGHDVV